MHWSTKRSRRHRRENIVQPKEIYIESDKHQMEQFLQFESHASVLPYFSFIDLIMLLQANRTCNRQVHAYWNKYSQRVLAQLIPPCLGWGNFKGIVYERARKYVINHQTFFPSITHLLWRIRGFAPRKKVWWNMWECRSCGCLLYTSPSPRDVEESRMPSSA